MHLCTLFVVWLATVVGLLSAQPQISVTAKVGFSALLPCNCAVISGQRPHIEWRTISETVFERMGEEMFQGEGFEDRVDVPEAELLKGNCSLVLKNVRPADEGVYQSYLMVKRRKRSLQTKRVFIQSVELSVDETTKEHTIDKLPATAVSPDDAVMNYPHPRISVLCLLLCLLFQLL